eukprot:CAMPEP_0185296100 /NCGR_PEP_ID=MMETSP1363-20130426/8861_1 /TAXON_ID=38817 /ORGANISM="Gephyrocapsa oceanica, Strain RCC1303" /LENGTH=726 /DNA_ID=CAMNT_0027892721 /DNA_START=74 /DNA_END=2254 /DNA_ORIENTATION=+
MCATSTSLEKSPEPAGGEASSSGARGETLRAVGGAVAGTLPVVAKAGGSAIWAAGSFLSAYVARGGEDGRGSVGRLTGPPPTELDDGALRGLGSSEVLRIANTLSGIFSSVAPGGGSASGAASGRLLREPELPRLVVVGTQSSGKSSLLNGFLAADILPLGEQMVTRAPLNLQLVHSPDPAEMRAEFGDYSCGAWQCAASVPLAFPDPTPPQLQQIRASIEAQTEARAGAQKGVSSQPIFLRYYSPNVPNLSLVDLPGLTMTALTDHGQPRDIKKQIREMIAAYIRPERTIILMVCGARADLEADPALELVKEHDPQGARTVGVLTKVDLMNAGTDVARYLEGSVPSDLRLALGYFAVRNRSPAEAKGLTVLDGFRVEREYFGKHAAYSTLGAAGRVRLGVPLLSRFLSRVLLQHLKQHLPGIVAEMNVLTKETERTLALLGPMVPADEAGKTALAQTLIASFCRDFVGALVEKRADVKTGRRIKDAFEALQATLRDVSPFSAAAFPDEYLVEAAKDCEGNHLSFPIPPIELLEHMLQHPEHRPIRQLLQPCLACLATVHDQLLALASRLLNSPSLCRFPQLQARVREEVAEMLGGARTLAQAKVEELIEMEEAYISTDDQAFLSELAAVVKKLGQRFDAPLIRSLLSSYYGTVVRSISNAVPKAVMLFMVRASHDGVYACLFDRIARQPPAGLLDEPPEMETKRRGDVELLAKLRAARTALESLA